MKRIYFSAMPLNFKLDESGQTPPVPTPREVSDLVGFTRCPKAPFFWPVALTMANTMEPGDEAVLVLVRQISTTPYAIANISDNLRVLKQDLANIAQMGLLTVNEEEAFASEFDCAAENLYVPSGYFNLQVIDVAVEESQNEDVLGGLFRKMLDCLDNHSVYYACTTFGTKSYPICLMTALNYALKAMDDNEIGKVVYQERKWTAPGKPLTLYNLTALLSLNGVVDAVSVLDDDTKKGILSSLIP